MNLCILMGKIVSDVKFRFMLNSSKKSITYFDMQLQNNSIVKVKAYDNVADYTYRKLKSGQIIIITGNIRKDASVECERVEYII